MGKLWQKVLDKTRGQRVSPKITFQHSTTYLPSAPKEEDAKNVQPDNDSNAEGAVGIASSESNEFADSHPTRHAPTNSFDSGSRTSWDEDGYAVHLKAEKKVVSAYDIPDIETEFRQFLELQPRYEQLVVPFAELRVLEYSHLERHGCARFDYVGTGLFSGAQHDRDDLLPPTLPALKTFAPRMLAMQAMTQHRVVSVEEAELRERVLDFLHSDADEYSVTFTPTAGLAIQVMSELYPFSPGNTLISAYDCTDEHIDGLHLAAATAGAATFSTSLSWPDLRLVGSELKRHLAGSDRSKAVDYRGAVTRGLFMLPVQSRISGTRPGLHWLSEAQHSGWHVLLDATAMAPGDLLNLELYKPDYVILAFHKVFGLDADDIGCLLVRRRSSSPITPKQGPFHTAPVGSTPAQNLHLANGILMSSPHLTAQLSQQAPNVLGSESKQQPDANPSSPPFTASDDMYDVGGHAVLRSPQDSASETGSFSRINSFDSLGPRTFFGDVIDTRGLKHVLNMGHGAVTCHVTALLWWLIHALRRLRHPGMEGRPLVELYGPSAMAERGSIVAFNLVDWKWDRISPSLVKGLASEQNIELSTGHLLRVDSSPSQIVNARGSERQGRPLHSRTSSSSFREQAAQRVHVLSACLGLVSNFEDVYRLWVFVAQFLDADYVYRVRAEFEMRPTSCRA